MRAITLAIVCLCLCGGFAFSQSSSLSTDENWEKYQDAIKADKVDEITRLSVIIIVVLVCCMPFISIYADNTKILSQQKREPVALITFAALLASSFNIVTAANNNDECEFSITYYRQSSSSHKPTFETKWTTLLDHVRENSERLDTVGEIDTDSSSGSASDVSHFKSIEFKMNGLAYVQSIAIKCGIYAINDGGEISITSKAMKNAFENKYRSEHRTATTMTIGKEELVEFGSGSDYIGLNKMIINPAVFHCVKSQPDDGVYDACVQQYLDMS